MSVHPIFSSIPLIICFQLGGPCWRICTSYTPNTTRDYCTTKGCLAYWMREDPIRCFQAFLVLEEYVRRCQQTLPYDLSKNDCFSIIFVVFRALTALASPLFFGAGTSVINCSSCWGLKKKNRFHRSHVKTRYAKNVRENLHAPPGRKGRKFSWWNLNSGGNFKE